MVTLHGRNIRSNSLCKHTGYFGPMIPKSRSICTVTACAVVKVCIHAIRAKERAVSKTSREQTLVNEGNPLFLHYDNI